LVKITFKTKIMRQLSGIPIEIEKLQFIRLSNNKTYNGFVYRKTLLKIRIINVIVLNILKQLIS